MKKQNLLLTISVITSLLSLFFGFSIYERADNVPGEEVHYNIAKKTDDFQVIHTSKIKGTNYAILVKFLQIDNDSVKKMEFKLTNFGGPVHFKIDSVLINGPIINFKLSTSLFSPPDKVFPYSMNLSQKPKLLPLIINTNQNPYDNHIKIKGLFGGKYIEESELWGMTKEEMKYCCGRQCKFDIVP